MANPVHEIATESLGTAGTVETFLRSEVRHIKGRGYAFSCYLVSRDARHPPDVFIYQLTQSDGFAITVDAGRFSVNKLRAAVESLTTPEMHARMLACKAAVRAMHAPSSPPSSPPATALVAVSEPPAVETVALAVAKPKTPRPLPKKGETWEDSKGEKRVILSVTPDEDDPEKVDILWEESRPTVAYTYTAMCQAAAWRRWELKNGGKKTS